MLSTALSVPGCSPLAAPEDAAGDEQAEVRVAIARSWLETIYFDNKELMHDIKDGLHASGQAGLNLTYEDGQLRCTSNGSADYLSSIDEGTQEAALEYFRRVHDDDYVFKRDAEGDYAWISFMNYPGLVSVEFLFVTGKGPSVGIVHTTQPKVGGIIIQRNIEGDWHEFWAIPPHY